MNSAHRVLTRSPRYAATAILTLAIGLAGVDTLLTVAGPVLLHPLPFPGTSSLYDVRVQAPDEATPGPVSHPGFLRLRAAAGPLAALGAYRPSDLTLTGPEGAEAVPGAMVTDGLAEALGVSFLMGRSFTPAEDSPGGAAVAVVSYDFWTSRLGSDPQAVGRTVEVNGASRTVVGVLARHMAFPSGTSVWLPLQNDDLRRGDRFRFLSVVARLRDSAGGADLAAALKRIPADDGAVAVRPLVEALLGDLRGQVAALGLSILVALFVVCINLGTLALVRSLGRRGDHVVQLALGASRRRLMVEVAAELGLLALLASALGWILAVGVVRVGARVAPPELLDLGRLHVSWGVLVVGAGLGLGAAVVASALPLLTIPGSDIAGQVRLMGSGRRSARAFSTLMAVQAALSLVLCTASLALARSLVRQSTVDLGYDARSLLEFRLNPSGPRYRGGGEREHLLGEVQRRLAAMPGVESVGVALGTPLSDSRMRTGVRVDGIRPVSDVSLQPASPGLISTLGRRVLDGRGFSATDDRGGEAVALVNQTMAAAMWPGASALGHTVTLEVEPGGLTGPRTVVGVVSDVVGDLSGSRVPEVLVPYAQAEIPAVTMVLRTAPGRVISLREIREVVGSVDPSLPATRLAPVVAHRDRILRPLRLQTAVLVAFALLALGLVLLSVYAVTTSLVVRRERELGIRMAIGCGPGALRREVLRWAFVPVLSGLGVGTVASAWGIGILGSAVRGPVSLGLSWTLVCAACIAILVGAALLRPVRRAQSLPVSRILGA